jgi:flagellar hook-associated protein 1 FlgK
MSLLTALTYSLSGMSAIQQATQVISSNITNAQREDYTRKSILLTSNTATAGGTGGVSIVGYQRATSDALTKLLYQSYTSAGLTSAQSDYLGRIQTLLGSSQSTPVLSTAMDEFAAAWRGLAASPEDSTLQQDVVFKGQNLAREVRRVASGLDKIQIDAQNDVSTSVAALNASLNRVKSLNDEIATASTTGQSAVDLMDLRDAEIKKIAELTSVQVFPRDNGRISLYTPAGYMLLDGQPVQFTWNGTTINQGSNDVTNLLLGGKIEGLVGVLDQGSSAATLANPGQASVYKIQQQLNKVVDLFTNVAGTFAIAYDSATPIGATEQGSAFFTGTTRYNFDVNANLVDGTKKVKQAAANGVGADMDIDTRSISTSGLSTTNVDYSGFVSAIVYTHSQNTSQINGLAQIYSAQKSDYTKRVQNEVGVNVDEELVQLTQLQNNYAATARVISTVQQMFDVLDRIV